MYLKIKNSIKCLIPPILLNFLISRSKYGWFGNYSSWSEAKLRCIGYDDDKILEKCKNAAIKVRDGEAVFERDSVLFYEADYFYSWIILSGLMRCAVENKGELNVLDFGGSLGSGYYQNRDFLHSIKNLSLMWNIVEQKNFVKCGKDNFENDSLKFHETIEECLSKNKPNVLLLSSTLQYLEYPLEWLTKFLSLGTDYIIIDRTAFVKAPDHIISVQKVPPSIYEASYPSWLFNENKIISQILTKYDIILEYNNSDHTNYKGMYFKGFIFKLKK